MPSLSLPNPQSQPPGQARHFRKTADPSVSEPKGALCIGTLPPLWDLEGSLPSLGSSSVGLGSWQCGCSPASLGFPGTDPEEAILSAFRLFDPSGKGVVNKDE